MKFVDEDMRKTGSQCAAHGLMVTQKIAGGKDQVVEIKKRCRSLIVPETVHDGLHQTYKRGENTRRNGL